MKNVKKLWSEVTDVNNPDRLESMSALATELWRQARHEESISVNQAQRDTLLEQESLGDWLFLSWNVAKQYSDIGLYSDSDEVLTETITKALELGNEFIIGYCENLLGLNCLASEDKLGAELHFLNSVEVNTRECNTELIARAQFELGSIYFQSERLEVAKLAFEAAQVAYQEEEAPQSVAGSMIEAGRVAIELADLESARRLFSDALNIFRFIGDTSSVQRCQRFLGEVESRLGNLNLAEKLFREAISNKGTSEQQAHAAEAMWALAQHNKRNGKGDLAARQLAELRPILLSLGLTNLLAN
jgi:tetratricopeptide (TPR) repeat protein